VVSVKKIRKYLTTRKDSAARIKIFPEHVSLTGSFNGAECLHIQF